MRWVGVLLLFAVLAAAACEEKGGTRGENATPTVAREPTATTPVATAGFYQLPDAGPIEEAEAQLLRSLAPAVDDVGEAFPDLAPFEQEVRGDLGQEYEHVDLAKDGLVAGYVAFYRPSDESHAAYMTFASFDDASGASSSMSEMIAAEFGAASTFEVGAGDESHGLTRPGFTTVLLRQERLVAFILILHPNGEDRRDGMRLLARDVARNMEDALEQ